MSLRQDILGVLRDTADAPILQEDPYVVVAPKSVEAMRVCVEAARDYSYRVLVLGSGSSFPPDFSILRDNVMAIMTVGLTGVEAVSSLTVKVFSGTPVEAIVDESGSSVRRTLGGLIADPRISTLGPVLGSIWRRIRRLEVVTGNCRLNYFSDSATFLVGSRGRLGIITAIELSAPIPIRITDLDGGISAHGAVGGDAALGGNDLRTLLDERGLFQW